MKPPTKIQIIKAIWYVIIFILTIFFTLMIAPNINKICFKLIEKFSLISDSSRLAVLFVPIVIYGGLLFIMDPIVIIQLIKLVNKYIIIYKEDSDTQKIKKRIRLLFMIGIFIIIIPVIFILYLATHVSFFHP
ncbi:MAG: hypothetical protein HFJ35_07665 [Clostridia bacterium]|nr:hypothetical protein [Clostridia bacterium]